jgi:transposase-like protein
LLATLSRELGIHAEAVAKWWKQSSVEDLKTGAKAPNSPVLAEAEAAIAVAFQQHTLMSLDGASLAAMPLRPGTPLGISFLHRDCLWWCDGPAA